MRVTTIRLTQGALSHNKDSVVIFWCAYDSIFFLFMIQYLYRKSLSKEILKVF